jgi:hypothetical protein
MNTASVLASLLVVSSLACGGTADVPIDPAPADAAADAPPAVDAANDASDAGAHFLTIHLRATTKPFAHADGWSGQTPRTQKMGVRALTLGKSANDPNPWTVFDLAAGFVEAPLDDGADTIVAKIPTSTLRAGNYFWAKTYVSHVRYEVDAVVHALGASVPGTFRNVQVLSDGTTLEGVKHDAGWYSFAFATGVATYGPVTGTNGPLPQTSGPNITLTVENGKASYGFPIQLDVTNVDRDVDVILEANTEGDFRWEDTAGAGHAPKQFDADPPASFEPVKQFGANALALSIVTK